MSRGQLVFIWIAALVTAAALAAFIVVQWRTNSDVNHVARAPSARAVEQSAGDPTPRLG